MAVEALDPTDEALDVLLGHPATQDTLLTVTLAPERDHALDAIRRLVAEGIVVSGFEQRMQVRRQRRRHGSHGTYGVTFRDSVTDQARTLR